MVVTIIQRRLTHYRVALFNGLKSRLSKDGIQLRVLHGAARPQEISKRDAGALAWAEPIATHYLLKDRLCWQPFGKRVAHDDLVIITQENAMLANHLALLRRPAKRLAFWGHGANLQGDSTSLSERLKTWSTRQVDWYFAYTRMSVELVTQAGFPAERVTQLDNAIDLAEIRRDIETVAAKTHKELRAEFGLSPGPIGLYLGSLYQNKRLDFLLQAAERIHSRLPKFQLVVVGAGPEQARISAACDKYDWAHYLGPKRGLEKAMLLYMSDVLLNPALVGLGILDAFASQTPMLTTDRKGHGPEIAYLEPDNGVIAPDNTEYYAEACVALLSDSERMAELRQGCRRAADRYTLPNMIENFANGILGSLVTPPR